MANWYGAARSNYVKIVDREGLERALEPFDIEWWNDQEGKTAFSCSATSNGGWPSVGYVIVDTEDMEEEMEEEVEFCFQTHVVPYMADGEVLVVMEAGSEKLRYITGAACAFTKGEDPLYLDLSDIYRKASEEWDISTADISKASY